MNPEIGDFDIYTKIENEDFDPETDYRPITDGNKRKVWPTEIIRNGRRQRWQPEIKRRIEV